MIMGLLDSGKFYHSENSDSDNVELYLGIVLFLIFLVVRIRIHRIRGSWDGFILVNSVILKILIQTM